ncbi:MAG TPA: chemotaxis protein CheB [Rhodopila sp.]|nr:chemotaxis protein CheB [Rhodopila sp.]
MAEGSGRRHPARGPPVEGDFPVVAIGASAGGLEACRNFLSALPAGNGMAFVLVQHLDPTHESMMVDLLTSHTSMTVRQATDGMPLERDHLYVIPPGVYLAVADGALHLSPSLARHGARLPFDFLLNSLAADRGKLGACVMLSGTGTDGSHGLTAVKDRGGLVIAQDPDEAAYGGMPQSAIQTGLVDSVLPIADIPAALMRINLDEPEERNWLPEIIDILRSRTAHDFILYKPGTLRRRIERRMGMAGIEHNNGEGYVRLLQSDPDELHRLAKDLLINVTRFFRDPSVFEFLAETIIPGLVRDHAPGRPIRIWVPGCSTGEETYSLTMLFREAISVTNLGIKLQVFASDIDPDAVAAAREGLYPETIESDVSPERIARFFSKEEHSYRVSPELRASVVFAVHDVLADPPFSGLDFISCRNLLIYLRAEAQAKVVALFHFALEQGGLLLLGTAESIGESNGRFETAAKAERLYRHIGRSRPGELGLTRNLGDGTRLLSRTAPAPSR